MDRLTLLRALNLPELACTSTRIASLEARRGANTSQHLHAIWKQSKRYATLVAVALEAKATNG